MQSKSAALLAGWVITGLKIFRSVSMTEMSAFFHRVEYKEKEIEKGLVDA